jgi:hypothetical protein
MKVSSKYRRSLETYLEWEGVRTPASGTFQETKISVPPIGAAEDGLTAAEALCIWESQGVVASVLPEEVELFARYMHGKNQRDWWTKEVGWWSKNNAYIPEEFLCFLGPLPFIELFGRGPITNIVRYYYDNHYSLWEFRLDRWAQDRANEWRMTYFERDDRDSALQNAIRTVRIRWIDPAIYKMKRRFMEARDL